MAIELSEHQARLLRIRAQGLGPDGGRGTSVTEAVNRCCGLQAQDIRQAPLSIRARSPGLTAADVKSARVEMRSIVRTWCMRGTLHYVTVTDLPWMLDLFGPLFVERGRRRLADLGLDDNDCERAVAIVREALADDEPLTRTEIADRLLREDIEFDAGGQAPAHIVRRACLEGVAIQAAFRDGKETYTLLDDWVSVTPDFDRDAALVELAKRYVAGHEPATPDDLHSWSGLYKRDVRAGWDAIENELTEVDIAGEQAWTISSLDGIDTGGTPNVRLLPMYDSYFLGHGNRDLVLPDEYAARIYPGGGVIRAAVLVNGLAAGTWTLDRRRSPVELVIEPFESFDETLEPRIEAEVESIGRFVGKDIEYRIVKQG